MARSSGTADVIRRFKAIPRAVKQAAKPAVRKGAEEIQARMQYLAPEGEGDLRASIVIEAGPDPLSLTVATDDPASLYQEYGTAKMARNSFFWPSVNTLKKRVRSRIDRAISQAAKKEFSK